MARARKDGLGRRNAEIVECERCPRLIDHCRRIASSKKRAYRHDEYWGRPVPSFGDPNARLLVVGLAPAAHGANRTGRMFTGDRSGDWLFRALHRAGFASSDRSGDRTDGLILDGAWITAAAHCAPPDNRPSTTELENCRDYLATELATALDYGSPVVVALGGIAFDATLRVLRDLGVALPSPRPKFGHLAEHFLDGTCRLLGSYHPSQQNTHTGRLTETMLDAVFSRARSLLDRS